MLTLGTFHILQVSLLTSTLVYFCHYISRAAFAAEAAELLRTHNGQGHVDVSPLAAREQVRDRKKKINLKQLTINTIGPSSYHNHKS